MVPREPQIPYAQQVLGVAAAVIPIVGSLFAGGWFLVDQVRLRLERKRRFALQPYVRLAHALEQARREEAGPVDWEALRQQQARDTHTLHILVGLHSPLPTTGTHDVDISMSAPIAPTAELVRQWILLSTAVVGLILLALSNVT